MRISKTKLPTDSILNLRPKMYDFVDSFQGSLNPINKDLNATELGKAFFVSGPKWVAYLFAFRNRIVSLFGLKTSGEIRDREEQLKNFSCAPGERIGLFTVFNKTDNELIIGEDDRHLNFRVSLHLQPKTPLDNTRILTISTAVEFNNWFGKLYFLPVRPFHKRIVPAMLKGMIKALEKESKV